MYLAKQEARIDGGRESATYRNLKHRLEIAVDHIGKLALDTIGGSVIDDMVLAPLEERGGSTGLARPARRSTRPTPTRGPGSSTGAKRAACHVRRSTRSSTPSSGSCATKRRRLIDFVPVDRDSRVKPESPQRSFLELDQSLALIGAACDLRTTTVASPGTTSMRSVRPRNRRSLSVDDRERVAGDGDGARLGRRCADEQCGGEREQ